MNLRSSNCRRRCVLSAIQASDRVRINIPDETDPDHDRLHGQRGEVIELLTDDAGSVTSDQRDSRLNRIALDDGGEATV